LWPSASRAHTKLFDGVIMAKKLVQNHYATGYNSPSQFTENLTNYNLFYNLTKMRPFTLLRPWQSPISPISSYGTDSSLQNLIS